MDELARIRIRLALEDLNSAFTHYLDHDRRAELVDLFTEDAVYTHGERRSVGREELQRLFDVRMAGGARTVRHVASGLRITIESETKASGTSVCLTFAHDGPVPVAHAKPHLVADFEDRYRLCADGRWRIAERNIRRIFVAEGNPGPVAQR